mgnify:CR=1 FL=1
MTVLEKNTPLACTQCKLSVRDCKCPDIDQRLADLGGPGGSMSFRKCRECGKHYSRCSCAQPFWVYSHNNEPMHEANRLQRDVPPS